MKMTSTKGAVVVSTVEVASAWLVEMQPSHASIDGHDIENPEGDWTAELATEAVAAAMAEGDWYWFFGSAYCPACVRCKSPAIYADDPLVSRGKGVSVCTCCRFNYEANA